MKPRAFDYVRAETIQEACELLEVHGEDARILAGGQSLMAVLNMRLAQPSVLIDISRSQSLAMISEVQTPSGSNVTSGGGCDPSQFGMANRFGR